MTKPVTAGRFFEMRQGLAAFQLLLLYLFNRDVDTVFYGRAFVPMVRCTRKAFDCAFLACTHFSHACKIDALRLAS
jgi:hypothetical protein